MFASAHQSPNTWVNLARICGIITPFPDLPMVSKMSILVSLACFIVFMGSSYSETDTLIQGQLLKRGGQLVSAFGTFKLGFFSHGSKYYVGIWYNTPNQQEDQSFRGPYYTYPTYYYGTQRKKKAGWIANRNAPIFDNSGVLTIGSDGNLKILSNGRDPISLTSVQASGTTSATLLDSGNLVLCELNSNGSVKRKLWQSFDYPTDTLLPGMKIGINLQTGHRWSLSSWDGYMSPAQPSCFFEMDRNGTNQLKISRAGEVYWTSGIWKDGHFNLSYELLYRKGYNFSFISNENEKYFTYIATDAAGAFPMITIDNYGSLLDLESTLISCNGWSLGKNSVGCVVSKLPFCRKHSPDMYFFIYDAFSGDSFKFNESENLSFDDCLQICFGNCSCVAFDLTDGCKMWSNVRTGTSSHENWHQIYFFESEDLKSTADLANLQKKKEEEKARLTL